MPVLKFDEVPQIPGLAAAGFISADSSGNLIAGPLRLSHTFAIAGNLAVPVGAVNYIPPWFVELAATAQSATIVKVRFVIQSGTSVTFDLQKNGTGVPNATGLVATTTAANASPAPNTAVVTDDALALVITAISGAPANLTCSIAIDYLR